MANVLLAGLMGGLQAYGAKRTNDENERKAAMAQAAEENRKKLYKEWELSMEAPKYESYEAERDGQRGKRTVKQQYVPGKGWVEEEQGFATETPKAPTTRNVRQGNDEVTQEFDAATGGWREVGRGPKFKASGGGSGGGKAAKPEKDPKATSLTSAEIEALFGKEDDEGIVSVDPGAYRQFVAYQARNAARDPKFRDAKFAAQQWANQVGVDENERLPGTIEMDESEEEPSAAPRKTTPKGQPGASRENPAPANAFTAEPPPGTWVKLPDGRVIQTR